MVVFSILKRLAYLRLPGILLVFLFLLSASYELFAQNGSILNVPSDELETEQVPTDPGQLIGFLSRRAVQNQRDEDFIFRGVRVVFRKRNKWKVKRNRCVRVSEGKISRMRHRWLWMPRRGAIKARDVKGRYLAPGLFDMHVHYGCDHNFRLALLRYGVTSVRNFDYYHLLSTERELIQDRNLVSPNLYNAFSHQVAGLSGGFSLADLEPDFLSHSMFQSSPDALSLDELSSAGWDVALESWPGDPVQSILEKGQVRTVEGMNVFVSPAWPDAEPDFALLDVIKGQDEIWEVPCATSSSGPWRLGSKIKSYYRNYSGSVPASISQNWFELGHSQAIGGRINPENMQAYHSNRIWILSRLIKEEVPLLLGSEAGSGMPMVYPGFSLHEEMQLFQDLGMEIGDVLDAATIEAARCLRIDDVAGRIARGYRADLVVLQKNPLLDIAHYQTIESVMVNGLWLGKEEMDWIRRSLRERMPFTTRKLK